MTSTSTRILVASNPDKLAAELRNYRRTATVEAEYGERMVQGSVVTLGHHGPRSHFPPPCTYTLIDLSYQFGARAVFELGRGLDAIGLSHIDLDAIGGVSLLLDQRPLSPYFWSLAGFVDTHGAHMLGTIDWADPNDLLKLYAWWAWSNKNRVNPPRSGDVFDATEFVMGAIDVLARIDRGEPQLIDAGREFRANEKKLNEISFRRLDGDVVVRESESFVNHLYADPAGHTAKACVSYNPKTCAVTVSLAAPIIGVDCSKLVQLLWGPEAGGHENIAGGPRTGLPHEEFERAVGTMKVALEEAALREQAEVNAMCKRGA